MSKYQIKRKFNDFVINQIILLIFVSEKQSLVENCTKQLERATELIGGLGGEGERWLDSAEKLGETYETLTGEI